MSKKVKSFLERVEGDNCVEGVLSILTDDMNPANDFHLKETLQSLTRKVHLHIRGIIHSKVSYSGVALPRHLMKSGFVR